ncbi:MAG: integrase [Bacteroidota bacterium]
MRNLFKRLRKQESHLENVQHTRAGVVTHWLKQYNLREVQHMDGHLKVTSTESYQRNDTESL